MKKKLLLLLFSQATLALTSCGGGNDGASTGTPVVAQVTIFDPTANGGCGNSSSYWNNGPALTPSQLQSCNNALTAANSSWKMCISFGGTYFIPAIAQLGNPNAPPACFPGNAYPNINAGEGYCGLLPNAPCSFYGY